MDREAKQLALRRMRRSGGFTLIEIAIVVVIIGIISALTLPSVTDTLEHGRGRAAAKSLADAFTLARGQAIRTGNNHVVFLSSGVGIDPAPAGLDTAGTALNDVNGTGVPILVLNDGRPGSGNQNCEIDSGEQIITFPGERGIGWGALQAASTDRAPEDRPGTSTTIPTNGVTFTAPNGTTAVTWMMFRPDGIPVAIDASCNQGRLGTGGGTVYISSNSRDYAVTLSPLGAVRVHVWSPTGGWTS